MTVKASSRLDPMETMHDDWVKTVRHASDTVRRGRRL